MMPDAEEGWDMNLPAAPIAFAKMSGAGNDFIVIDNRRGWIGTGADELARRVCRRRLSLGADGLILIETDPEVDFCWRFYNSDGSPGEMCGNGARCAARFAHLCGIADLRMRFRTLAGMIAAEICDDQVTVDLTPPGPLTAGLSLDLAAGRASVDVINTGVPHAVMFVPEIEALDVFAAGREIRWHPQFAPAGTNADFAAVQAPGVLRVRTYERGVEGETLACGTGVTAAALAAAVRFGWPSPIAVITHSGSRLTVDFAAVAGNFSRVRLRGDARTICTGELQPDAWQY